MPNHQAFAEIIAWYQRWHGSVNSAHDAAMIQVLTKITRIAVGAFKDDNYVDAAAYLGIAYECEARSREFSPSGEAHVDRGRSGD